MYLIEVSGDDQAVHRCALEHLLNALPDFARLDLAPVLRPVFGATATALQIDDHDQKASTVGEKDGRVRRDAMVHAEIFERSM
jgi:hypothetical protein